MILFFDTETTGLNPGRVIQLSYILQDNNTTVAKNFFFGVDYIEPSASAVHGFTVDKLKSLCGDSTFSCHIDEIAADFLRADLVVAHNFAFDLKFMIAEFGYEYMQFRYKNSLDTMKFFTPIVKCPRKNGMGYKYPKLTELTEFLDIYPYDITTSCGKLFGNLAVSAHDARFDTTALYLAFNEGSKNFAELNEIKLKHLPNDR